jgi:hypothetical protein
MRHVPSGNGSTTQHRLTGRRYRPSVAPVAHKTASAAVCVAAGPRVGIDLLQHGVQAFFDGRVALVSMARLRACTGEGVVRGATRNSSPLLLRVQVAGAAPAMAPSDGNARSPCEAAKSKRHGVERCNPFTSTQDPHSRPVRPINLGE